jgi:mannose-1-phosphate guanylyltransferase/mannose-6-phosphate isomerase
MIVVIIAGGSGTRLWPLSTPERPKHLLNLTGEESLLQGTYRRAKALTKDVYVITEVGHADLVREQLPELSKEAFIVEPARRGTSNCLIAGLAYIQARHDHNEPIAFIAADHYIRDTNGFIESFRIAGDVSRQQSKITLVGIDPTYPSTGFGYIHKEGRSQDGSLVYNVLNFKEKPPFDIAQQYMQSGDYLWNCSYFVGSVNVFVKEMKQYAPDMQANYQKLCDAKGEAAYKEAYLSFETDTIDYALSEKVAPKTFLVVPASFDWMDLGSFKDAHEAVESDKFGNHVQGLVGLEEVENSFIRNEEANKPVAVIGLDNIVVVNTPHGILVARKDLSQKVKDIVKKLEENNS